MASTAEDRRALFPLQAEEAQLRRRLIINETLEFKETELRQRLLGAEISHRNAQLATSLQYIQAQHQLEHTMVDEYNERRYISFLYAVSVIEWRAFIEKNFYQTLYLQKRGEMFNTLFNEWVDGYLLRKLIAPQEHTEREFAVEMDEEAGRRDIIHAFRVNRIATQKREVENEEEKSRANDFLRVEDNDFSSIMAQELSDRVALSNELFTRWSSGLFEKEETERRAIWIAGTAGEDFYFEQIKAKLLTGAFRIWCRNEIVAKHKALVEGAAFEAHSPAVTHAEARERIFLAASEENEWHNELMEAVHAPMMKEHWRRLAVLALQRVGRAFLVGRQSVFRNEYLEKVRRRRLAKLDVRDDSILLVQRILTASASAEFVRSRRLQRTLEVIFAFATTTQYSIPMVVNRRDAAANTAIAVIQRAGRGLFSREEVFELSEIRRENKAIEKDRQNDAALTIQHVYKHYRSRREIAASRSRAAEERRRSAAATAIAKTVKMHLTRKQYHSRRYFLALELSAQRLQRTLRGARVRQFLYQMLYCRTVQTFARALVSSRLAFDKFATPSAIKIQCAFRSSVARSRAAIERTRRQIIAEDKAARVISRAMFLNRYLNQRDRRRGQAAEAKREEALADARRAFEENQHRLDTLSDLWRIGRGYIARSSAFAKADERRRAVLAVQSSLRYIQSDQAAGALREAERQRLSAALTHKRAATVQMFARSAHSFGCVTTPLALEAEARQQEIQYAAATIGRVCRGFTNGRRVATQSLAARTRAAVRIQCLVRCFSARRSLSAKEVERAERKQAEALENASLVIGTWLTNVARRRRTAAKTIQLFYHRHSIKMKRNQELRRARENIFAIERRELLKAAQTQIEMNVARAQRAEFVSLLASAKAERKTLFLEGDSHLNPPAALSTPRAHQFEAAEEKARLVVMAAYIAAVRHTIVPAKNEMWQDMWRLMGKRYVLDEAILRSRICASERDVRRSLLQHHNGQTRRAFYAMHIAPQLAAETSSREAIADSERLAFDFLSATERRKMADAKQRTSDEPLDTRQQPSTDEQPDEKEVASSHALVVAAPQMQRANIFVSAVPPRQLAPIGEDLLKRLGPQPQLASGHLKPRPLPGPVSDFAFNPPSGHLVIRPFARLGSLIGKSVPATEAIDKSAALFADALDTIGFADNSIRPHSLLEVQTGAGRFMRRDVVFDFAHASLADDYLRYSARHLSARAAEAIAAFARAMASRHKEEDTTAPNLSVRVVVSQNGPALEAEMFVSLLLAQVSSLTIRCVRALSSPAHAEYFASSVSLSFTPPPAAIRLSPAMASAAFLQRIHSKIDSLNEIISQRPVSGSALGQVHMPSVAPQSKSLRPHVAISEARGKSATQKHM